MLAPSRSEKEVFIAYKAFKCSEWPTVVKELLLIYKKASIKLVLHIVPDFSGPEPAILDWYGHCKLGPRGVWGPCSPRKIF